MAELPPIHVAFLLFPNVTQLDLTGPAQVLSRLGNVTIDLVARTRAPVMTDALFALTPTATFTAKVTGLSPTGTVTFKDGTAVLGPGPLASCAPSCSG